MVGVLVRSPPWPFVADALFLFFDCLFLISSSYFLFCQSVWLSFLLGLLAFMESLILAQDERWRRA